MEVLDFQTIDSTRNYIVLGKEQKELIYRKL